MKQRTKRISLEFMGDDWKGAYINSRLMHWEDFEKAEALDNDKSLNSFDRNLQLIKLYFVGGKGPNNEGELVDLTEADLSDLDVFSAADVVRQIGFPDPKASDPSMTTTPESDPSPDDSPDSSTASDLGSQPAS